MHVPPVEEPPRGLAPGDEVDGRYRLEALLREGSAGPVFEASHLVIGKQVALECLSVEHLADPTRVERFFHEVKTAGAVEHPNVVKVFDGRRDGETTFVAMDLLRGETLRARLDRESLPAGEAADLFIRIAAGVAAVHDTGIAHGALRPGCVFLTEARADRDAQPKVFDFGVRALGLGGESELYRAPGVGEVDLARADVYALGAMLYEAVAGVEGRAGALPLDQVSVGCPLALAEVVATATSADPGRRFASARDLRAALIGARSSAEEPVGRVTFEAIPHSLAHLGDTVDIDDLAQLASPPVTSPTPAVPLWLLALLACGVAFSAATIVLGLVLWLL